jgi:hypothetical protein
MDLVAVKRSSSLKTTVESLHHEKPKRTTNPTPHFLFHIPAPRPSASSVQASLLSSLFWVTPPPFFKPFFKCAVVDPVRDQTEGHPLKTSPDPAPEAKTERLPSDSTSLLRISSSKKSYGVVVKMAEKTRSLLGDRPYQSRVSPSLPVSYGNETFWILFHVTHHLPGNLSGENTPGYISI